MARQRRGLWTFWDDKGKRLAPTRLRQLFSVVRPKGASRIQTSSGWGVVQMAMIYGRDMLARPLRLLQALLKEIREGKCEPNSDAIWTPGWRGH